MARARIGELSLHLLLLHRHILLLHLEFDVVKDTIKIYRIQLDWNFHSRVLLKVHKWLLALFWINHSSCTLNSFAFLHRDLLSIEDHELNQTLDHNHTIVWLASDRVVNQRKVKQIR